MLQGRPGKSSGKLVCHQGDEEPTSTQEWCPREAMLVFDWELFNSRPQKVDKPSRYHDCKQLQTQPRWYVERGVCA